jgi:Radical SAM superfamily
MNIAASFSGIGRPVLRGEAEAIRIDGVTAANSPWPLSLKTGASPWSNAASAPINASAIGSAPGVDCRLRAVVEVEVSEGCVGLSCASADLSELLSREQAIPKTDRRLVFVPVPLISPECALLIRNWDTGGIRSRAKIFDVSLAWVPEAEETGALLDRTMSALQRRIYQQLGPHQTFAVTCWGSAASHWLAAVLNSCAGVYCAHSHQSTWQMFGGFSPISSLRYLQMISMMARAEGFDIAGDVHGVPPVDIAEAENFFGDLFRSAALVRDPQSRLMSCYALKLWTTDLAAVSQEVRSTVPKDILSSLPTESPEELLFVHCTNLLNTIIYEQNCRIFRTEDCTTNAGVLGELVRHLTAGKVAPEGDIAERLLGRPAIRSPNPPDRIYEPWQLRVVNELLSPEAARLYRDLGYDLSWLGERPLRNASRAALIASTSRDRSPLSMTDAVLNVVTLKLRSAGTSLTENSFEGAYDRPWSFQEVMSFARHASWSDVRNAAPGRDGYQSWIAPFKGIAGLADDAPRPELQLLVRCVAAMNAYGARLDNEQLEELEAVMRGVTREEALAVAAGDGWLQNYLLNVWEFVHGETELESLPWNVTLPVADLCNARCTFCTSWIEGRSLVKLDQVRNFGEVFARAHQIGLVGHGEPLAHPQFDKLCEIIAETMDPRAFIYTITNGVHLRKWSAHLNRINLESVSISLNAATAETHDLVMGLGPDAFDEVVSAIRDVVAASSPTRPRQVYITMVVTQQNMHEVADFVRLGNELGVSGVWLRALLPQSSLVSGLNYHVLAPNLHPEFRRHKAEALAAIAASEVPVQAEPEMWDADIFSGPLKEEVARNPPPLIPREEALRDRDLRQRNRDLYGAEKRALRGQALDVSGHSTVKRYEDGIYIGTPAAQWSCALSTALAWPADLPPSAGEVRLRANEVSGTLGFGLLDRATNSWIDRQSLSEDGDVKLSFPADAGPIDLVVENWADDVSSAAIISQVTLSVGAGNQRWTGSLEVARATVHNPVDPLEDGENPFNRSPRFACKAVYYNLYLNEMFFRIVPCCYMTTVPGFEEIRFDGSVPFMEAWNAPAMVELRQRLVKGPLFGACKKCAATW